MGFHVIWYEYHATGGHPITYQFLRCERY